MIVFWLNNETMYRTYEQIARVLIATKTQHAALHNTAMITDLMD